MELTDDQKKSLLGQGYIASEDGAHFACRVLVPAGKMTTQATQKISEVSEKYGKGYFSLTQRLNVEIPWIPYQDLDNVGNLKKWVFLLEAQGLGLGRRLLVKGRFVKGGCWTRMP